MSYTSSKSDISEFSFMLSRYVYISISVSMSVSVSVSISVSMTVSISKFISLSLAESSHWILRTAPSKI